MVNNMGDLTSQANFDRNYIENLLDGKAKSIHTHKVNPECNLSKEQRDTIRRFNDYLTAQQRMIGSRKSYLGVLKIFGLYVKKPFESVTKEDLLNYFRDMESRLKPRTLSTHVTVIKLFYRWLYNTEDYPELVRWLKQSRRNHLMRLPEHMLTREEIKKMVNACDNIRDQAIIMTLFESGCRVSELVGISMGDVEHDEYGIRLEVSGKTGDRKIRILDAIPYIERWLDVHPNKDDINAPLFIDLSKKSHGKRLYRDGIYQMLKEVAKRAGIKKNVTCHLLRHIRLTELAKVFTEQELKVFAGWSADSRMCKVYVHLSGEDIDRKFLERHGLSKENMKEKRVNELEPKKCYKCETINPSTAKYCEKCLTPLDIKEIMEMEEKREKLEEKFERVYPILKMLEENPEILKQLKGKT